ncbi:MAG: FtsQ-type POTRA domain-containing protein [bacterium]|nr:MAG: FtsQ-type POTRA domain-containing protein [bacterium]
MSKERPKSKLLSGKPARRKSALKKTGSGAGRRVYLIRAWWILRGALAGSLLLAVLTGGYLGALRIMALPSLAVRNILVEGCRDISPEQVKALCGVSVGMPLLRVDLNTVRMKVAGHPQVLDAAVVRELPGTLRITIRERTPVAAVMGRGFVLVDAEGVVLSRRSVYPEGYPLITGVSPPMRDGEVAVDALGALHVLMEISGSGLLGSDSISEARVEGRSVLVSLMGGGTLLVMDATDVHAQLARLSAVIQAGAFNGASVGYDLRFKGRVIGIPGGKRTEVSGGGATPVGG